MSDTLDVFIRGEGGQNWHVLRDIRGDATGFWLAVCGAGEGNKPYDVRLGYAATRTFLSFPGVEVPLDVCPSCAEATKP